MKLLAVSSVLLLFAGSLCANTFTVGDDRPADFAEVSAALASPLVGDGDVLLVEPGSYAGITVDDRSVAIPAGAAPGTVLYAQSAVWYPDGDVRLSNCVPIVVP